MRRIWGRADTVLFIFAGAAAEFALNKSVDWLYFTSRLPKDPVGRMFTTISYAHQIIFMDEAHALAAIAQINTIHKAVEEKRGLQIPAWAYRDVLFLLIHYSISAFELLQRRLKPAEKEEVFSVFRRIGTLMHIANLPDTYAQWADERQKHLRQNLERSHFSTDLFLQYKRQLRPLRFRIMLQVQAALAPHRVRTLLGLQRSRSFGALLAVYRCIRGTYTQYCLLPLLMPRPYFEQVYRLNRR